MKKRLTNIVMILAVAAFMSSCVSMSSLQTARVTEPGEFGVGLSAGYVDTEIDVGDAEPIKLSAPYFELAGRFGITEKLDLGARLGLIGTAGLDLKYQFFGDNESPFASSAGFGVSYVSISSSSSTGETSSTESKSNLVDLTFPVTFSYHPTDFMGLYVAPKYVLRLNNYTVDGVSDSQSSNWLGATAGIRLGRKNALFAEYSFFGSSSYDSPFGQFMVGVGFNIK